MKSEFAYGTTCGRPSPRPLPTSPPSDMPNMPWTSWYEPPGVLLYSSAVSAPSHPSMRCCTCEKSWEATSAPAANMPRPRKIHVFFAVAT